jgi:hypothetical protein
MARKGVRLECPACGSAAGWTPGDIVAEMNIRRGGLHIGEPVTALVQVICDNCAHVRLFAAEPLGLYESQQNCK